MLTLIIISCSDECDYDGENDDDGGNVDNDGDNKDDNNDDNDESNDDNDESKDETMMIKFPLTVTTATMTKMN